MNSRVALLLAGVLALAGGAFAISWDHFRAPRTVGQSVPPDTTMPAPRAQALPPSPNDKPATVAQAPAAQAPAVASEAPKPDKPAAAAAPAKSDNSDNTAAPAAAKPVDTAADKPADTQPAPVVAAPAAGEQRAAAAKPTEQKPPEQKPTAVVSNPPQQQPAQAATAAPPAGDKPTKTAKLAAPETAPAVATPAPPAETPAAVPTEQPSTPVVTAPPAEKPAAAPAEQPSTPVMTAPPAQTEKLQKPQEPQKPVAATPAAPAQKPVVEAPTPAPEKGPAVAALTPEAKPAPAPQPTIVMTPLPEERPEISESLLERTSPAKYLFAAKKLPSVGRSRAIGYYPRGCLAGGIELPVNGPTWQVMRLSRNRNWGHPELIRFLERFAPRAAKATGWPGILIGDMSQPRGGPLPWGHRSHQIGLDVDIWFKPMPDHRLSRKQRDTISATHLVERDGLHLNPKTWSLADAAFIRTAAEQPEVERVLVNARIKQELCKLKGKQHWPWMAKVRPWYGHDDHIHVRLKCPADSPHCRHQPAVPGGAGCSKRALAYWFSDRVLHPRPPKHPKPAKQIMLTDLPHACKIVLNAPAQKSHLASEGN